MNKEQVILQLKSLKREAEIHINTDDIFKEDCEALDYAIKVIEKMEDK